MRSTVLMIVALAVAVLAPTSHAGLVLTLSDGVHPTLTIDDTDGDGLVNFTGAIGNWIISNTTGLSNPLIGTSGEAALHLDTVDVSSAGGGVLTITLTNDDFSLTPAPSDGVAFVTWGVGGFTSGSVVFESMWPGGSDILPPVGTYTGFFSDALAASFPYASPFSLTQVAVITHNGAGRTSFNFDTSVVPVPGAILLGLLGMGAAGLKLRRFV